MKNLGRNTVAVLVITLFVGLAVFSAVQLGGRLLGTSEAGARTATSPAALQQTGSGSGYSDAYGDGGTDSAASGGTLTCPATGCGASSCHATQ